MNPNQPPSAASFSMRQPSLSDLLAGVQNGETFAFGLPHGGLDAMPLAAAARTYTVDDNGPFGNIPPVRPRPEMRRATTPFSVPSSERATGTALSMAATSSENSVAEKTSHALRRSQRLAASSTRSREAETQTGEGRKRKARSAATAAPRKRVMRKKPPPGGKDDSGASDDRKPAAVEEIEGDGEVVSCCICMCQPEKEEVSSISGCEHMFCFDCIGKWADRENTCPLCKCRFTSIMRVHKAKKRKGEKQAPNSKRVKQRDQRADVISGPAIEAMLASIAAASNGTHSRFGRFLVALGSRRPPNLVSGSRRTTLILEDDIFSDETDDDELPMINFNQLMRRAAHGYPRTAVPPPSMFDLGFGPMPSQFAASMPSPAPPQQSRSHASNTFEQNAGTVSNPLEILSEDDEDDDSVEVYDVNRSSA